MLVSSQHPYRGRLAPSPTGLLHLGHARTFWQAQLRAEAAAGTLILRNDDLDRARCRPEFTTAALEDLHWFGLRWTEGPDLGGPFAPYAQSERHALYQDAFEKLRATGLIYPCHCSRKEILSALSAPHAGEEEPLYPGTCRPAEPLVSKIPRTGVNWRFRVPIGESVTFHDHACGPQTALTGQDFGDILIWRKDDFPSYQLACVVDDAQMQITEVVRGRDLVQSTFRQLLLHRALGHPAPEFFHCELVTDAAGHRLAKRDAALTLRTLREAGRTPEELLITLGFPPNERPPRIE